MARATPVKGLDPRAPFGDEIGQVLSVRIADLWEFERFVAQPGEIRELHNMRIAAKRLRYCMEFFSPCIGGELDEKLVLFKQLQDYLGDIHDCDAWALMLVGELKEGAPIPARQLLERNSGDGTMLKLVRELAQGAADESRQSILAVLADILERRQRIYAEFAAFWQEVAERNLKAELEAMAANPQPESV